MHSLSSLKKNPCVYLGRWISEWTTWMCSMCKLLVWEWSTNLKLFSWNKRTTKVYTLNSNLKQLQSSQVTMAQFIPQLSKFEVMDIRPQSRGGLGGLLGGFWPLQTLKPPKVLTSGSTFSVHFQFLCIFAIEWSTCNNNSASATASKEGKWLLDQIFNFDSYHTLLAYFPNGQTIVLWVLSLPLWSNLHNLI